MLHIFIADGFEEIEALTTIDILRRCGIEVATVSVTGTRLIKGSHGIPVMGHRFSQRRNLSKSRFDSSRWYAGCTEPLAPRRASKVPHRAQPARNTDCGHLCRTDGTRTSRSAQRATRHLLSRFRTRTARRASRRRQGVRGRTHHYGTRPWLHC